MAITKPAAVNFTYPGGDRITVSIENEVVGINVVAYAELKANLP